MVTIIQFAPVNFGHDSGVEFGPQVICDNALVMHVIPFQHACLFQFVECGDDLLKGAIDDSPSFINVGFYLLKLHFVFHVPPVRDMTYESYDFKIIRPKLEACREILSPGLAGVSRAFGAQKALLKQFLRNGLARTKRPFRGLKTANRNHACGLLKNWQWA
jgi:hypothetical protein